jgi:hypothetical protein
VRQGLSTGERAGYATALDGLWGGLAATLTRLDALAADPEWLDEEALDVLPALQYRLHRASELAVGLAPPPGSENAHAELSVALEDARDATAEVVEALDIFGPEAAAALVHEWRGALFRVRLARHRLGVWPEARPVKQPVDETTGMPRAALAATLLVIAGTVAFTTGAVAAIWPLWALGLTLVGGGFLAYRP